MNTPKKLDLLNKYENKSESISRNSRTLLQNFMKRRATKYLCQWSHRVRLPAFGLTLRILSNFGSPTTSALPKNNRIQFLRGFQKKDTNSKTCFHSVLSLAFCKNFCTASH